MIAGDTLVGVMSALLGITGVYVGISLLVRPGTEESIDGNFIFRDGLIPDRFLYGALPIGISMILVGLATIVGDIPIHNTLMWFALVFFVLDIIAVVWAPKWLRPWRASRH